MLINFHTTWWQMLIYLGVALLLSTAIGFERELHRKPAGMRTHTLVGLGAALFTVVSKYGFGDVVNSDVDDLVSLDPSRIAAQIVSGIGFIGAGLVFVRRDKVRGLTTAASIWLTAAVGMSAGAGLLIPAVAVTAAHLMVVSFYPLIYRSTRLGEARVHTLSVRYLDGTGALRQILQAATEIGFQIQGFGTRHGIDDEAALSRIAEGQDVDELPAVVEAQLVVEGAPPVSALVQRLSSLAHISKIRVEDDEE